TLIFSRARRRCPSRRYIDSTFSVRFTEPEIPALYPCVARGPCHAPVAIAPSARAPASCAFEQDARVSHQRHLRGADGCRVLYGEGPGGGFPAEGRTQRQRRP